MKKTRGQRRLALLLTLAMCLTLAPAAWAAEGDGNAEISVKITSYSEIMEPGIAVTFKAATVPEDGKVEWTSGNPDIARVNSTTGVVSPVSAGEATIVAHYLSKTDSVKITVSGITVDEDTVVIHENEAISLPDLITAYGNATKLNLEFTSEDPSLAKIEGAQVKGLRVGKTTINATSNGGTYRASFTIQVEPDETTRIPQDEDATIPLKNGEVKSFRDLKSYFDKQIGGDVQYVTGLLVSSTSQGTLYYGYKSEAQPGRGVGQVDTYYRAPVPAGQRDLLDITFVPKPDYVGGDVTITYTAVTKDGRTYSCKIVFTVQGISGSGSEAGSISIRTDYGAAVHFDSVEFGAICREKLGVQLDYVIFSQPPERQGTLYTNYSSSNSYGGVVDIRSHYSRKALDDVWFVPAPGFSGAVTVYYTGFATNGESYSGQVFITVEQEDSAATGGLGYTVSPGGVARFNDDDFDDYCHTILDQYQTISGIRFESLPGGSEGVLYYDYQTATNPGTPVSAGTVYYNGVRTPRIDRLAFVPATGFTGIIKIPFTGWSTDGTSFSGNVEINVRGGVTTGDIYYSCAPGKSVTFVRSDFISLSNSITGRTISSIRFQDLPDTSEGYLYYNSSRITDTGSSYTSSNISRLSFRASSSFSGLVNISFVGTSTGEDTFTGVITIGSSGSSGGGSGNGNIRYATDAETTVVFYRDDFDDLSLWETDRTISSIRIDRSDLPSSSQGSLYQNYRSSSNKGTKITSSTTITASGLDQLAFVPASGYTGTVYIDFTATATGSGGTFDGTVEVEVDPPTANVTAQYSTRTAPVRFYSGDLARSGYSLSSIQFTSLPSSTAGYLYAQYISPIYYGQRASTGISYRTSGSNLISNLAFVPRAGYTGTVTIPYTGTNSNGTTFTGEVVITVSPSYGSSYFTDMASYNNSQRAAVDFLYDINVTRGMGNGQYGPENSIRRGDFARMLYQAFEFSPASGGAFLDVSPDTYYAEAVNALYVRGIVSGIGNGYYAPDSTLTRQDAVCMIQRAMQAVGWSASDGYASALSGYGDSGSVSGYAQGAMALAVQRGYLPATGGWLNPLQPLTRVDMAEMLHRVLTY